MKPKKSLGQNFLHHHGTLQKILKAADLRPNDHVIEIGPGHGVLTELLAQKCTQITAIELDDRLIDELEKKFQNEPHVKILHQDALTFIPPVAPYVLVANIPYYITSPILNHFLKDQPHEWRPKHMTLLMQKEVAQKTCATPGDLSVLTIQVQLFGTPQIIAKVPPSHFKPAPNVDSAILNIKMHEPLINDKDLSRFFEMIHTGFAHKRKKLIRNLEGLWGHKNTQWEIFFEKLQINQNTRAQELTIQTWKTLYETAVAN